MIKTYSLAEVAAALCGDSMLEPERWITRQITSGRFTARKVGRTWRMTQTDLDHALAVLANKVPAASPAPAESTHRSEAQVLHMAAGSLGRRRMATTP